MQVGSSDDDEEERPPHEKEGRKEKRRAARQRGAKAGINVDSAMGRQPSTKRDTAGQEPEDQAKKKQDRSFNEGDADDPDDQATVRLAIAFLQEPSSKLHKPLQLFDCGILC